ncbi:MAG: hypothetical protein JWN72_2659, partial [Thermoleophilia bacterium]|nr:hypothetical protein [Thermoleophilia bacterium]
MTHDDIQPLLAEHALATLAPEAAARVDAHLAGCAACRVEFDELLAAVTELELAASPVHALAPRAGALDDLLAAARSTPQEASVVAPERVARDRGVPQRPAPRRRFRFGFAAVAGLAACVALGGSLVALDSRNDRITSLERRLAEFQAAIQGAKTPEGRDARDQFKAFFR